MRTAGRVVVAAIVCLAATAACGSRAKAPPPTVAPADAAPATATAGAALLTDAQLAAFIADHRQDAWYSLYLSTRKAGWAHVELRPTAAGEPGAYLVQALVHLETNDDGQRSVMELSDVAYYAGAPPFGVVEKRQVEASDAGRTERVYRAHPDHVELVITTDGQAAPPRRLPPTAETIVSQVLSMAAPATLRPGQRTSYATFDDDTEADQRTDVTVAAVADEVIAGVKVPVVTVELLEEGDSVPMRVRVADGIALAIVLGPGLRLDLADRAAAQAQVEAVSMMDTSVAIDRRLGDLSQRDELTLIVGAAGDLALPTGPTQTVERLPDGRQRVTVRRGPGAEVTAAERARALAPTAAFDADAPTIAARAQQLIAGAASDRERVERIVMWVYTNLGKDLSTELASASQVLSHGRGDCTEHTLLVVALARAAGIPARDVGGLMYEDTTGRFYWHAWAQVALDGRWVAVDGAWGQPVADVGHLAFDIDGRGNASSALGTITIAAAM